MNPPGAARGRVWIVGAGPGDPRLLTIGARAALDQADTVIHDRLVSEEILLDLRPDLRLIDVGKSPGHHPVPQEEINRLLIAEAREGRRVVRLKGGDPFLFGRGGEEALALSAAGIPWELVPGISSALAVPALAGIPLTHRGLGSSLHVLTWRGKDGGTPAPELLRAVALARGTLVILMGGSALGEIGEGLLAAGFGPETPVAVIENGSTPYERRKFLPLRELAAFPGFPSPPPGGPVPPPVLVAAGPVCALAGTLGGPLPPADLTLAGLRVVVTHSEPGNGELCRRIRGLGGAAIPYPCLSKAPAGDLGEGDFRGAAEFSWLVFTSPGGVDFFFGGCREAGVDFRLFGENRFAVVGPATAGALREKGFIPDLMPADSSGRALGEILAERMGPAERALLIRSRGAAPELAGVLRDRGRSFRELSVYETRDAGGNAAAKKLIAAGAFDMVCFSSPGAAAFFERTFGPGLPPFKALCIGESTAEKARGLGMEVYTAAGASIEGLCRLAGEVTRGLRPAGSP